MSRPKGSKNKKTLEYESRAAELIVAERARLDVLIRKETSLMAKEADIHKQVKETRKQLRECRRKISELQEASLEWDQREKKKQAEKATKELVDFIMSSDEPADVLLEKIKKAIG